MSDIWHRVEERLRNWQATLTASATQFRHGFADSPTDAVPATRASGTADNLAFAAEADPVEPPRPAVGAHHDAARRGARVRHLGEAAVAAGWRRKTVEGIAPRVAGSTPMTGDEIKAALGVLFLALSGSYLLKTLLTALRHREVGPPQPSPYGARTSKQRRLVAAPSTSHPAHRRTLRTRSGRGGQS